MSAPFTHHQEARLRELIRCEIAAHTRERPLPRITFQPLRGGQPVKLKGVMPSRASGLQAHGAGDAA